MSTNYIYGTGRRKTAVARVRLLPGDGSMVVNGKDAADYFGRGPALHTLRTPFRVTETEGRYSASVLVAGGGFTGQAGAIRHGIARALVSALPGHASRSPRCRPPDARPARQGTQEVRPEASPQGASVHQALGHVCSAAPAEGAPTSCPLLSTHFRFSSPRPRRLSSARPLVQSEMG